jgi:predicted Zn-dependent protease
MNSAHLVNLLRRFGTVFMMLVLAAAGPSPAIGQTAQKPPPLIRDAEIENLLRIYTKPIFKAAGLNPDSVKVYLISDSRLNAFVANGQRIFINTGLLQQAKTPNEVIGVLAHESGHLAGGHLARMGIELERVSYLNIIGMLVGAAAMAGGVASGDGQAARAGSGVMMGSQGLAQRSMLSYARAMEASADQAAIKYLNATGQSGKGMLDLFQRMMTQSIATLQRADPYLQSHPMPLDRIRNLEIAVKASPNYAKADPPGLILRHELMQAKLTGFLSKPQETLRRYPKSDTSLPARYARAIALFRQGDTRGALPVIDGLIEEVPKNPYFWELKGQALLEGGRPREAVAPLRKAVSLLPSSGLLQILLAQALVGSENPDSAQAALTALRSARKTEEDAPIVFKYMAMAYGQLGDIPRAELATAEAAFRSGDRELASEKAKRALQSFKKGAPEWLRANDILNFAADKKDG